MGGDDRGPMINYPLELVKVGGVTRLTPDIQTSLLSTAPRTKSYVYMLNYDTLGVGFLAEYPYIQI